MSDQFSRFVADCKNHSNPDFVRRNFDGFPPELLTIVNDPNGEQVFEAGIGLFKYLADLVEEVGEQSLRTWLIPMLGYPDHEHTDLISPFFDVFRTQRLWYNSIDHLNTPTPEIKAELILNVYFRWYINAIELMRKALAFTVYCRSQQLGRLSEFSYNNLLYRGKDPTRRLRSLDPSGNVDTVTQFYTSTLRHALAHGNVIVAIPQLIAVRQKSSESVINNGQVSIRDFFIEDVYPLVPGTTADDSQKIVTTFQKYADPCYQAFRVFMFLYLGVHNRHVDLVRRQWPTNYQNQTLGAIIGILNSDSEGMRYWRTA